MNNLLDLNFALVLEPSNSLIKADIDNLEAKLSLSKLSEPLVPERRRVEIEEIGMPIVPTTAVAAEKPGCGETIDTLNRASSVEQASLSCKLIKENKQVYEAAVPTCMYDFEKDWKSLKESEDRYRYFKVFPFIHARD
jgi:hypothetical protein